MRKSMGQLLGQHSTRTAPNAAEGQTPVSTGFRTLPNVSENGKPQLVMKGSPVRVRASALT